MTDSPARFLGFAFASADLLFEIEPQGKIAFVLGATQRVMGVGQAEAAGRAWRDLVADSDHDLVAALIDGLGPADRRGPVKVELAPLPIVSDVPRLRAALDRSGNGGFVLIGRRHLRSNNYWMHNVNVLVKGKAQCTLQVNPGDAARVGQRLQGRQRRTQRTGVRGAADQRHGAGDRHSGRQARQAI